MNIEFVTASVLPGLKHKAFKEDCTHPNAVYESEIDVPGGIISLLWDIFSGDIKAVYVEAKSDTAGIISTMTFKNVKTYAELKQLLSYIPLPYPENWPI